jgi:hypothetical protein
MATFSDLNLNITNLSPKAVDQLVENAILCMICFFLISNQKLFNLRRNSFFLFLHLNSRI